MKFKKKLQAIIISFEQSAKLNRRVQKGVAAAETGAKIGKRNKVIVAHIANVV